MVQDLPEGVQAPRRGALRVPDHSPQQDRGFRRALQAVLLPGRSVLQVCHG